MLVFVGIGALYPNLPLTPRHNKTTCTIDVDKPRKIRLTLRGFDLFYARTSVDLWVAKTSLGVEFVIVLALRSLLIATDPAPGESAS